VTGHQQPQPDRGGVAERAPLPARAPGAAGPACRGHREPGAAAVRADSARGAHRDYARRRAQQIAYGRWQPWTDAEPVRRHVHALRARGASYRAIAHASGVSPMTIHHLLNGCPRQHQPPPSRIGSAQARRLLTTTVPAACRTRMTANGARLRLRALVALGHSPATLASQAGISPSRLRRLLDGQTRHVSPVLHTAACALYHQMWNQQPPEHTRREQASARAARYRAGTAGWPPPMALDDDRLDDPAYRPRTAWRQAAGQSVSRPGPAPARHPQSRTGHPQPVLQVPAPGRRRGRLPGDIPGTKGPLNDQP
jgi:lambda repressor-like predicted transcriptional regulator